ncbi:MAG: hypothetical protein H6891_00760 [Brucellaceae bacterium]|nr:hypothetical protein [Brucellaceae bacterium]
MTKFLKPLAGAGVLIVALWGHASPVQAAQSACLPEDVQKATGLETYDDYYQANGYSYDVCAKFWAGLTWFDTPDRTYLAKEEIATSTLTLGIVEPESVLFGATFGAELEVNLGFRPYKSGAIGNSIRFGLEYSHASRDQYIGQVDPGAGFGLGIPGPLGGASGAFLPANPANIVQDAAYRADLSWAAPYFNFERRYEARHHAVGVFVGTQYSYLGFDQSFHGTIPGYLSDFRYDDSIETNAYGVHVGVRGRYDVGHPWGNWQPQVSLRGQLGAAYVDAKAVNSLTYGGFISGSVPNTTNLVSDSYVRPYYSIGASFALNNVESSKQVFADFQLDGRPWFPTLQLDGTNASVFDPATATVVSFTLGGRIRF